MDDEIVLQDTQTPDEELDLDLELAEGGSEAQESEKKSEITERERRLYARLKKTEAELKEFKKTPKPETDKPITQSNESQFLSRDEAILIAKGVDEKGLETLKAIAKGKGVSLLEAQQDELYLAFLDKKEKEEKAAKAKIGASQGSGVKQVKSPKDLNRDEHKALWLEKTGH